MNLQRCLAACEQQPVELKSKNQISNRQLVACFQLVTKLQEEFTQLGNKIARGFYMSLPHSVSKELVISQ